MLINYLSEPMLTQQILPSKIIPTQCKCWSFNGNHRRWAVWNFTRLPLTTMYHSPALLSVSKQQNYQIVCFKSVLFCSVLFVMNLTEWYGLNYCSEVLPARVKRFWMHTFTASCLNSFKIIYQKIFHQHLFFLAFTFILEIFIAFSLSFYCEGYNTHRLLWIQIGGSVY